MRTVGAVVCDRGMAIVLGKPGVDGLGEAVDVLREWQLFCPGRLWTVVMITAEVS